MQVSDSEVYQGQFGQFTITPSDRQGVIVYRAALMVAALCFGAGTTLVLQYGSSLSILNLTTWLYAVFWLSLGVALAVIHIYLEVLHRALQVFWAIGGLAAIATALQSNAPLALTVYKDPISLVGVGFTFVALTGIFFKEAFCFNRIETKVLTVLLPFLLIGHLIGRLPMAWEQILLATWATLFLVFAARKLVQAIPPDIGDKTVFAYLKQNSKRASNN